MCSHNMKKSGAKNDIPQWNYWRKFSVENSLIETFETKSQVAHSSFQDMTLKNPKFMKLRNFFFLIWFVWVLAYHHTKYQVSKIVIWLGKSIKKLVSQHFKIMHFFPFLFFFFSECWLQITMTQWWLYMLVLVSLEQDFFFKIILWVFF